MADPIRIPDAEREKGPVARTAGPSLRGSLKGGDQRRRLLLHHLPLALVSAVVLFAFTSAPLFDVDRYPHVDLRSGAVPQLRERAGAGPGEHGAEPAPGVAGDALQTPAASHLGGQTPAPVHGGRQTTAPAHGGGQTTAPGHGAAQSPAPQTAAPQTPAPTAGDQTPAPGRAGVHTAAPTDGGMQSPAPNGSGEMGEMMGMGGRSFLGLSMRQLTVATGYLATGLLVLTLLIGPLNLLLRRRTPISSYVRRDVGAWTAVFSVIHMVFGFQVEGSLRINDMLGYFFAPGGTPLLDSFGLGNWTGLAAVVIVVGLLAISSDFALRKLKAGPWKALQRLNYALFALVFAHAFFYGALLRTMSPFTFLLAISVVTAFVGQIVGIWLWRRRYSRRAAQAAAG
jgi:sulfoxide reductase heme-binding subunit YedZ